MNGDIIARKYICKYVNDRNIKGDIICSIQDGNMGGNYLRNYRFSYDNNIVCSISNMDYFDNDPNYESILQEKYVWIRLKKDND